MKHKLIFAVAVIFLMGFAAASFFGPQSDYYNKYEKYKYAFIPYYSTIGKNCSESDRETAQSVINLAGEIMTDTDGEVHPYADKLETYGVKYSLTEKEIAKVEAKLNLITADFTFSNGYMWVEYHKQSYSPNGDTVEDYECLAYWKLKKQNGLWRVVKIKETKIIDE